jgi:predicted enzyme related to lactoylglutathione lyase
MIEPNMIVLYVDNIERSSAFYKDLLGITPKEASATFHVFRLSNGMGLGLKAKHAVTPPLLQDGKSGELAFVLGNSMEVDALYLAWQQKGINVIQNPTNETFGYTFLALDPDDNRLRVASLRAK